jgi:tetratricopeptide (TPR) repeat protein
MGRTRRSRSDLPRAPLELLHPLALPPAAVTGVEILSELPRAQALPLFSLYRAALSWSTGASAGEDVDRLERHALARLGEGGCWPAAAVIALFVAAPPGDDRDEIARACLALADWALSQQAQETALAFAGLAALVWPGHPRYAWTYARLLRGRSRMREAEHWFRRSHRIAVWLGDWEAQAKCLNSLGVLSYLTGNYRRAETRLARALALAAKRGLRLARGEILHDLFVLELNRQDFVRAEEYAAGALRHYLPAHDRLPALAHDLACLWMDQGHFTRALPLLRAVVRRLEEPSERFQSYAAAARAAGGAGDGDAFEWAWRGAQETAARFDESHVRGAALVDLGRGASSLGRWTEAVQAFERARSVAAHHGEAGVLVTAEAGLMAAAAERGVDTPARPQQRRGVAPADVVAREMIDALQPLRPVAA